MDNREEVEARSTGISLEESGCDGQREGRADWVKDRLLAARIRKGETGDFPGGPVVKNLPSNAGDVGSITGRGTKIPHAAGQQSLRTTTEPMCCKLQSPRATTTEPMHCGACASQLEREKNPACHN